MYFVINKKCLLLVIMVPDETVVVVVDTVAWSLSLSGTWAIKINTAQIEVTSLSIHYIHSTAIII